MKKVLILLFCFQLFVFNIYSQTEFCLPNKDAVWSVYDLKYFPNGDSIYNGKAYIKFYESFQEVDKVDGDFIALVRNDTLNKKIYAIPKDSLNEKLIYDFDVIEGEILNVQPLSFIFDGEGINMKVEKIDSIYINDVKRKRIWLSGVNFNFNEQEYWIEGIGSSYGPLDPGASGVGIIDIYYPNLICYHNNDELIYQNPDYNTCDVPWPVYIDENVIKPTFKVYTNDNGNYTLESNEIIDEIEVYNVIGNIVLSASPNSKRHDINLLDQNKGLYFVRVGDRTIKLIKE